MSNMLYRGELVSDGQLQIPDELLRQLKLNDGDEVRMMVVDGELLIRPHRSIFQRIAERTRRYLLKVYRWRTSLLPVAAHD